MASDMCGVGIAKETVGLSAREDTQTLVGSHQPINMKKHRGPGRPRTY